ncbi:nitroreductase family protein [Enterococcus sp. AZ072]|uniref:nitroreductase family protein n=1 Tax=unclassified Enterococcus TaxID=2608891 RepID=UPI003D27642A
MSSNTTILKKMIPKRIARKISKYKNYRMELYLFKEDRRQFLDNYAKYDTKTEEQLKGRIILYSHAIEKGLSREDTRLGFGKEVINSLAEMLELYLKKDYSLNNSAYLNGLSVVKEYIGIHKKNNFDISAFLDKHTELVKVALNSEDNIGGVKFVDNSAKMRNQNLNFELLANNRVSIRDYANEEVDIRKINHAIKIATKSPSVCNRQSSRIYVITNKEIIEDALKLQGGFNGYELPPALILVTVDNSYFVSVYERKQGYTDGGIFSMSLLYGLEFVGLAACALNTMFDEKKTKETKKLLSIPDSENLVMYISTGNFKTKNSVPKSFRFDVDEITKYI